MPRAKQLPEKILLTTDAVNTITFFVKTNYSKEYFEKYLKYYFYILEKIWSYTIQYSYKENEQISKNTFRMWLNINVNGKSLVDNIKADLINLNIIISDNSWQQEYINKAGQRTCKCIGYKMSPVFLGTKSNHMKDKDGYDNDKIKLMNKMVVTDYQAPRKIKHELQIFEPYKSHIECLKELKIDYTAATEWIQSQIGILQLKPKAGKTTSRILTEDIATNWLLHCFNIKTERYYFTKGKQVNRVFHNLANLPGKLKQFLFFNLNTKCKTVDIVNSQPLLINALMHEDNETMDNMFKTDCERGKFYEHLCIQMGLDVTEDNRNKIKVEVYTYILFGKTNEHTELMRAFKQLYPIAYRYIVYQKSIGNVIEHTDDEGDVFYQDDEKGNNNFAIRLQNIEAQIIMNAALPLHKKNQYCLTIHDALFVEEHNQQTAADLILLEFKKYNIKPTIK